MHHRWMEEGNGSSVTSVRIQRNMVIKKEDTCSFVSCLRLLFIWFTCSIFTPVSVFSSCFPPFSQSPSHLCANALMIKTIDNDVDATMRPFDNNCNNNKNQQRSLMNRFSFFSSSKWKRALFLMLSKNCEWVLFAVVVIIGINAKHNEMEWNKITWNNNTHTFQIKKVASSS